MSLRSLIFYFLSCSALLISSCQKEKIELVTMEADSHTTYDLYDVTFIDDSTGFACGGDKWTKGIFLRSIDGGKTWSVPDSIFDVCAYALQFFSATEGYVSGNNSKIGYTTDGGYTFNVGMGDLDYRPIVDIEYRGQNAVRVAGDGYLNGTIYFSDNAGAGWTDTIIPNALYSVCYADDNTVFVSGYGAIYRSTNGGRNFDPLDIRGEFFIDSDFPTPTTGYFAGYEGSIVKTTDAGNSFETVMKGNTAFSKREHFRTIKFWDENNGYAAGDNGLMYKTNNGGESWKLVEAFTDVTLRQIHLFSANSGVVVGNGGKVFLFRE